MKCSICDNSEFETAILYKNYPIYVIPIPINIAKSVEKEDLTIHKCIKCGHLQILNPKSEIQKLIYEKYYTYYVLDNSETFLPFYRKPFISFIDNFFEKLKEDKIEKMLEIGCSTGKQVSLFKKYVSEYWGIDPSDNVNEAHVNFPGGNFIKGYFPQDIDKQIKFDLIVSQFNLEHIHNINEFLTNIYFQLKNKGKVIIQVPDIEDYNRKNLPLYVAHEHLHYFSKISLRNILIKCGFEIIDFGEEGPSIIVAAEKSNSGKKSDYERQDVDIKYTKCDIRIPNDAAFYGVGPLLFYLSDLTKLKSSNTIFDDNKNYWGQAVPSFGNIIIQPSQTNLSRCSDIVLSLNKIYYPQIIKKLKSYGIDTNIYYFNEKYELVKNKLSQL